jgi:hypothetical protein
MRQARGVLTRATMRSTTSSLIPSSPSAPRSPRARFVALALLLAAGSAACGGAIGTPDDQVGVVHPVPQPPTETTPVTPAPAPAPTTQPTASPPGYGHILVPSDATLTLRNNGGFAANGTDSTICTVIDETFTFEVTSGRLTWSVCEADAAFTKNDYRTGTRTLAKAETAPFMAALAGVSIVQLKGACAGDVPAESLEMASPTAITPQVFHDLYDRCGDTSLTHVVGLDEVKYELTRLSH